MGLTIGVLEVATEDAVDEAVLNHLDLEADHREDVAAASSRMEEVAEVEVHVGAVVVMIEAVDREAAAEVHTINHA